MTTRRAVPMRRLLYRVALELPFLLVVVCLVHAGEAANSAYGERVQAGQFLAAPRCSGSAGPAGDCYAWLTRSVSESGSDKNAWHVNLDGGLSVWYPSGSGWVTGLTAGEPVPVLVWEGSAQALRDPQGHVLYGMDSGPDEGFSDIGWAVCDCSLALLALVARFAMVRWWSQRRIVVLAVLTDAGISGLVGGATIQSANSVGRGVIVGVIVFCAIGLVASALWRFRRTLKLIASPRRPQRADSQQAGL